MPHYFWHDTGVGAAVAGGVASAVLFPGSWMQRAGALLVGFVSAWLGAPIATPLVYAKLASLYEAAGVPPDALPRDSVAGTTGLVIAIAAIYVLTAFVRHLRRRLGVE